MHVLCGRYQIWDEREKKGNYVAQCLQTWSLANCYVHGFKYIIWCLIWLNYSLCKSFHFLVRSSMEIFYFELYSVDIFFIKLFDIITKCHWMSCSSSWLLFPSLWKNTLDPLLTNVTSIHSVIKASIMIVDTGIFGIPNQMSQK